MDAYKTVSSNDTLRHLALPGADETLCGKVIADERRNPSPDLACDICNTLGGGGGFLKEPEAEPHIANVHLASDEDQELFEDFVVVATQVVPEEEGEDHDSYLDDADTVKARPNRVTDLANHYHETLMGMPDADRENLILKLHSDVLPEVKQNAVSYATKADLLRNHPREPLRITDDEYQAIDDILGPYSGGSAEGPMSRTPRSTADLLAANKFLRDRIDVENSLREKATAALNDSPAAQERSTTPPTETKIKTGCPQNANREHQFDGTGHCACGARAASVQEKIATNWTRDGMPIENGFDLISSEEAKGIPFLNFERFAISDKVNCPDCETEEWIPRMASCTVCMHFKCANCMDDIDNLIGICRKCANVEEDYYLVDEDDWYPSHLQYLAASVLEDEEEDILFLPDEG
jgi:hypothetical protein